MPFKDLDRLEIAVGKIPDPDTGIKTARSQNVSTMRKTERSHLIGMIPVSATKLGRPVDDFMNTDMVLA